MNWKTILVVVAALFIGFGVLIRIATRLPEPPSHQVFINGDVLTMDAANRIVEADVRSQGDKFIAFPGGHMAHRLKAISQADIHIT